MVSPGLKLSALSLIDLSPPMARPSDTSVTLTAFAVVVLVPAGLLPHATVPNITSSARHAERAMCLDCIMATLCSGNRELLSGVDQVGVLDLILVRFVNAMPLVGVAVEVLRDLRQAVSSHDNIGLALSGCAGRARGWRERRKRRRGVGGSGRAARLNIGKVGFWLVFVVFAQLVEDTHLDAPWLNGGGGIGGPL